MAGKSTSPVPGPTSASNVPMRMGGMAPTMVGGPNMPIRPPMSGGMNGAGPTLGMNTTAPNGQQVTPPVGMRPNMGTQGIFGGSAAPSPVAHNTMQNQLALANALHQGRI